MLDGDDSLRARPMTRDRAPAAGDGRGRVHRARRHAAAGRERRGAAARGRAPAGGRERPGQELPAAGGALRRGRDLGARARALARPHRADARGRRRRRCCARAAPSASRGPVDGLALPDLEVPGDFSSAAPHLVAGALLGDPEVRLEGVNLNPRRTGLLAVMRRMGADVREEPGRRRRRRALRRARRGPRRMPCARPRSRPRRCRR